MEPSTAHQPTVRFNSLTPNLVVRDIDASTAFYSKVLGFTVKQTVPDQAPFVFVWLERGSVEVFLNDQRTVEKHLPAAARNIGGSGVFILVEGLDELHEAVSGKTALAMPPTKQFME